MNISDGNINTDSLMKLNGAEDRYSTTSFNGIYLPRKNREATLNNKNLSSEDEKGINLSTSDERNSWYAEVPAQPDDLSSKCKKVGVQIEDLIPWVKVIAQKILRTLPPNIMLNDLVQDGMIGLIMALREFDNTLGVPFHAFAMNKVRWAIMEGLRAGDWADNNVRGRANKVAKTSNKLRAILHRKPKKSEIAAELGVRVEDIVKIIGDAHGYNFVRIGNDVEDEVQDIPDLRMEPSAIVERREAYTRAVACLRILHTNERKAFVLRIMCNMSGLQAATEMGLSESRVSQLYKTAIEKLANFVTLYQPQELSQ